MPANFKAVLWLSVLLVSGCSSLFTASDDIKLDQGDHPPLTLESQQNQEPFDFEIVEEVNDGSRLHLVASLQVRTDWRADEVVARLVGLDQGQIVSTAYYPFSKKKDAEQGELPEILRSGEQLRFALSIPSSEISDYQLELFWGADAKEHLSKLAEFENRPPLLTIRKIELFRERGKCQETPCPIQLTVSGELYNSGQTAVCDIELAVGLIWVAAGEDRKDASYDPDEAGEEHVRLTDLCLESGVAKPIRFVIDRDVPEIVGGAYQPMIRIVGFQSL